MPLPVTLVELLRSRAAEQPDKQAFIFLVDGESEEARMTYAELDRQARAIAASLQERKAKGERALLLYPPGLDYIAAFFGCLYAGVVAVPVYPPDPARLNRTLPRLQAIAQDAEAKIVLTTGPILSLAETLFEQTPNLKRLQWLATDEPLPLTAEDWRPPPLTPRTIAFLQYTSGSTGSPKGVMISHGNLIHNSKLSHQVLGHSPESVGVIWLPPYHDMGLIGGILQPLYAGFPVVLFSPLDFLTTPLRWLQAVSRYRATTSGGPNFAYDLCVRKINPEQKTKLDLSSWDVAFCGAEPIRAETIERFSKYFEPCGFRREAFYPCYGLAEGTLIVSGGLKSDLPVVATVPKNETGQVLIGCGRTLQDQQILIVDPETLTPSPPGEVGEIWVAGPSVAQGYWNKPKETEETFRAFLKETGEGPFLRTGDLGFLKDGELFVTGRLKDLIIIRGQNYYPQDIELTVEGSHPSLRRGCGAAFSVEEEGEEKLVVVQEVETRTNPDLDAAVRMIRQAVSETHELQVHDVVLIKPKSIPKTSSGKIQRFECRKGYQSGDLDMVRRSLLRETPAAEEKPPISREILLAASPEEQKSLLGKFLRDELAPRLGIAPSEFDLRQPVGRLGIDSLVAAELVNRIESSLGVRIDLAKFFQGFSAEEIAAELADRLEVSEKSDRRIVAAKRDPSAFLPLSSAQERLWFFDQLSPGNSAYLIPIAVEFNGPLDRAVLQKTLHEIIRRHETLRTTFETKEGVPAQVVSPFLPRELAVKDLSHLPETERESEKNRILFEEARRPLDLRQGPLFRPLLLRLRDDRHILLALFHHMISDGWSAGLFLRELGTFYRAFLQGVSPSLSAPPVQYADYTLWQRSWLEGKEFEGGLSYWKERLAGTSPMLPLPTDHPRPKVQSFRGKWQTVRIPKELSDRLKRLSQEEGATFFMTLLAAFQTLLHRTTGETEIGVGTAIANRNVPGLEGLIGFFANTLILKNRFDGDLPFRTVLRQVRDGCFEAYAHAEVPFEKIVEALHPERHLSYVPFNQIMFVLDNELGRVLKEFDFLKAFPVENGSSKRDLSFHLVDTPRGLEGTIEYDSDLFDPSTIVRTAGHFQILLEGIANDPDRTVSRLPMLNASERDRILSDWGRGEKRELPGLLAHELFEKQARERPNAPAVSCQGTVLTYGELNRQADQLARRLRSLGIKEGKFVGIRLDRSPDIAVAILGILKAGGAYVPLDPNYPKERLSFMLRDSRTSLVITREKLAKWLSQRESEDLAEVAISPDQTAYLLYTSGSTGEPKGVRVTHANLKHYLPSLSAALPLLPTDRYLHTASFAFASSVRQLFLPLVQGASVTIATAEEIKDPLLLFRRIREEGITVIDLVPSYWRNALHALARLEEKERRELLDNRLRLVVSASEPLLADLPEKWREFGHQAQLINSCGQTETTGTVCTYAIPPRTGTGIVPIGRPIPNTFVLILDPHQNLVPAGVPGELHVGGAGLAGYLNRPDLASQKFIPNPFPEIPGEKLYRTGDLARFLSDGNVEFLGRADEQVKIRGFRVEPGEIETVLRRHSAVREAAVAAWEETPGDRRLAAYLVASPGRKASPGELRSFLRQKLPDYMIPSAFVFLSELPLTPTGKLDRKRLPSFDRKSGGSLEGGETTHAPPRTPTEKGIAEIWSELLGVARVGLHDNFFDLGGHSLLAPQMLFRLQKRLGIDLPLRVLFEAPTVQELAARIETGGTAAEIDLEAEAFLDPAIRPNTALPASEADPKTVFLTGATGFLGSFLLSELLQQTQADIYCLVRSGGVDEGFRKIKKVLEDSSLWNPAYTPRIVPVPGDLAERRLGLSEKEFLSLAGKIDVIYHSGAWVNFIYPYSALKASNVLGTEEVLRLASRVKVKPVHYVSTVAVFPPGKRTIREEDEPADWKRLPLGYSQSKWVAERLVRLAGERGLPVTIYRPGRIGGESLTGVVNPEDFLLRAIQGCIRSGTIPDLEMTIDITPVDFVSQAIVRLSRTGGTAGKFYHLVNPRPLPLKTLVQWIRDRGYPLALRTFPEWRREIAALGEGQPLSPFMPLLNDSAMIEILLERPEFDCRKTLEELEKISVRCPPVDGKLLEIYFSYFARSGLLAPPNSPRTSFAAS